MSKSAHPFRPRHTIVAAVSLSVAITAGCSKNRTAEDYIQSAQEHRTKREISAAIIDLKNALQKDSKNLVARTLLAEYFLDLPDPISAEAELQHAQQDGAAAQTIAVPLAQTELLLGKPEQALKAADPDLPVSASDRAKLLALRAQAYLTLNRKNDASAALDAALKEDSDSPLALSIAARYALGQGDTNTAKARIEQAEKAAPGDPVILDAAGVVAYARGDYAGSDQAYQKMLSAAPWNLMARMGMARAQIGEQKFKDADTNLDLILKSAPNEPRVNYLRALSAYREADFTTAKARSERALNSAKDYAPAVLIAGASSYALHQYEQANTYLVQYVREVPSNVQARKLLALVQVTLNRSNDAVKTLSPALDQAGDDPQLLAMLGGASARSGDLTSANSYYGKAVERQPDNASLRADLGVTEVALGRTDLGVKDLEQATQQNPDDLKSETALFVSYLRAKNYDKALELAERLKQRRPNDAIGFNYAGIVYAEKGDVEAAQAAFEKAREVQPGDGAAARSLAALAIRRNDLPAAERYYEDLLKANPKELQAYVDLAAIQARAGQEDKVRATLESAIKESPDDPTPRIALGRVFLLHGQAADALNTVRAALEKNPRNPGLLEVAGRAQMLSGDLDSAQSTLRSLTEAQPDSAAAHRYLADAYAAAKKNDLAITQAKEAVTLDPKDPAAKVALARIYLGAQEYDDARKLIDDTAAAYPDSPTVAEAQGDVALAQGRLADAITALRRGLEASDNSMTRARLATVQARAGHLADAEHTALSWLDAHPDDTLVHIAMGGIYLGAHRLDDARVQYAAAVKLSPDNAVAQNNLAWTLLQQGDRNGAIEHARLAAHLAPAAADALDTLGVALLADHQAPEAVTTLTRAAQLAQTNNSIQFHLAQALNGAGDKDRARTMLRALLAGNHPFEEKPEAQKLLTQLGG